MFRYKFSIAIKFLVDPWLWTHFLLWKFTDVASLMLLFERGSLFHALQKSFFIQRERLRQHCEHTDVSDILSAHLSVTRTDLWVFHSHSLKHSTWPVNSPHGWLWYTVNIQEVKKVSNVYRHQNHVCSNAIGFTYWDAVVLQEVVLSWRLVTCLAR